MKKIPAVFGIALVGLGAYLSLWPVPVAPQSWEAPAAPGYIGPFAVNNKLANLKKIPLGTEEGPEHLVVGRDGKLYATVASGAILRMNPDGSGREVMVNTGGRVLGFDFDRAGNLIAADAFRGLLSISPDKKVTVLADKTGDSPILYANSVVVARNGKVYFSDSSTRFGARDWGGTFEASILDILEQSATGRVIEYDPASQTTRVVAKGLSFANGVALSQDERSLFVAETGKYRIWKLPVDAREQDIGHSATDVKPLFDNLPGYPDNLMRGLDGKVWVGLVKPRNPTIDGLASKPFMRKLILRLPRALWPIPKAYGHVVAFTEEGKVVADLQDPAGVYPETTAVTETADRLYVQSLHARELGWLPK